MKKTIAKIMAAAMVLSTMAVPTANAAATSPYVKNFTLTDESGKSYKVIENGAGNNVGTIDVAVTNDHLNYWADENLKGYVIDTGLDGSADVVTEEEILKNATFYAAYVGAMSTFVKNGTSKVSSTVEATTPSEAANGGSAKIEGKTIVVPDKDTTFDVDNAAKEVTTFENNVAALKDLAKNGKATNKAAAKAAIDTITAAYKTAVAGLSSTAAKKSELPSLVQTKTEIGKEVVASGAYLDVNVTAADGVTVEYAADGSLMVRFPQTAKWASKVENLNSEAIVIPITVKSGLFDEIEGKFTLKLGGAIAVADDAYWNAFVKLKASNNRYIPIRVHVDVVDGTRYQFLGLYAEIRNGSVIAWRDRNGRRTEVSSVDSVSAGSWINNRLQIQDVETVGLDVLRSDVAKGKNLMLDEAYIFNVYDITNVANWDWTSNPDIAFYDWATSNVYTDIATVSVGKIQDIRSGLFKKCKEKLVHAKNVKWIRNGAFRENKQLKKAILSDDVSMKKINEKSFYKCKKLNTVKVKVNTLKHVGKNAFGDSTDKKSLKFNLKAGSKAKYNKAVKLFKKSGVKKAKFRKI